MSDRSDLEAIYVAAASLGPDELRVLRAVTERLVLGRRQYGELDLATDPRDWAREAAEEALDLSVYLAIRLLGGGR